MFILNLNEPLKINGPVVIEMVNNSFIESKKIFGHLIKRSNNNTDIIEI